MAGIAELTLPTGRRLGTFWQQEPAAAPPVAAIFAAQQHPPSGEPDSPHRHPDLGIPQTSPAGTPTVPIRYMHSTATRK
ncbi:MAG: hypothetical protein KDA55_07625 [Planctomycetales bacterium]|nr:hypothetical protein [Planctomycetales bacterium]MCA9208207.1 hypothetical protein [Planctomycetales bacterium]